LQAKTRDLTEALQQQTATADVLKVISRSAFDLDAVMNTLTRSAAELCDAEIGSLHLREGDVLVARGISNSDPKAAAYLRDTPVPINEHTNVGRSVLHGSVSNIADYKVGEGLRSQAYQDVIGFRSFLCVPLMRDGRGVGVFSLARRRVAQFSQRQIELLQTFADQAVIAIENARLFDEVRAKTRDLTEALQQQTATADVLKVISRSAFDLQPVLDTLVASAARLCDGYAGAVYLREGELFHAKAVYGGGPMFLQFLMEHPMKAGRQSMAPRVILSGKLEQIPDALLDPEFVFPGLQRNNPARAFIGVPLLRDGRLEGVFILTRNAPGLFSESEVNLLQTFADQAVIAIENVRLFEQVQAKTRDLSEALEQQTATADVLKVISRSTFDLQTVLDTLVGSAARLCEAEKACIFQREGELYRWVSNFGFPDELVQYAQAHPFAAGPNSTTGRVALEGKPIQVADVLADPDYTASEYQRLGNYRTNLGVPLLREGVPIGVFVMTREKVRPFNERQIELLQTFADQAVIAIENVRLFEETQARTKELAQSIEELRAAQDRLIQSEKLASLGQLTAGIAHEIKNPLNFVNNFAALSRELIEELRPLVALADAKAKDEIEELMQLLEGNLEKVTQHGKRADSIVKNMLLHSRESSGEHRLVDLNALVEESVNLAYHGARAEKPGFNITLVKNLDPAVGEVDLYPQEFTRVLLNLISNGFYAATKRKAESGESFESALTAATRDLGDKVEIKIRDNGTGIPDEVKAKMFNPFFTTKPAGEGTGLGLSLSHDIVVKQHGGTIAVETEPGAFTEFTIVIPRGGNPATSSAGDSQ
jgi:two-component system, NtrC family, sensor kinase